MDRAEEKFMGKIPLVSDPCDTGYSGPDLGSDSQFPVFPHPVNPCKTFLFGSRGK